MDTKVLEAFEKKLHSVIKKKSIEKLENFLLTSLFPTFSEDYKQSVMDFLVFSEYQSEHFELAKWALTTKKIGLIGNIHENADRPLRLASFFNTPFAKYLLTSPDLAEKADINRTNDGSSALLQAIKSHNLEFVQYLTTSSELTINARLDLATQVFDDPLCQACNVNATEIVKFLLSEACYLNPDIFNAKLNIARFNYDAVKKIVLRDNVELLQYVLENKLVDIDGDLHYWFCNALTSDSVNIATYLEKRFPQKPDLMTLQYNNQSIFVRIASFNHNYRMKTHSYLTSMLENPNFSLCEEDMKAIENLYVYQNHDSNHNTTTAKLSSIMEIYQQKHAFESKFPPKNISEKKLKI